jgi:hypothetical protein
MAINPEDSESDSGPKLARWVPNPFFKKRINKVFAGQKTIIFRLPFKLMTRLGLTFHNFNPRLCNWVDKQFRETFFNVFPGSFEKLKHQTQEQILGLFKVSVLNEPVLLLEEGGVAKHVIILLKGEVKIYRRGADDELP